MSEKSLGRINLKKVRVQQKHPPEDSYHQLPSMVVFMGVDSSIQDTLIEEMGERVSIGVEKDKLQPKDFERPNQRIIVIDRTVIGRGVSRACRVARTQSGTGTTVILILSESYRDPSRALNAVTRFEADLCMPYPTDYSALRKALDAAIEKRRSFSSLGLLPNEAAQLIDRLERELNRGSYYDLFGLNSQVKVDEIKSTFRRLSRVTHPDRHSRLKIQNLVAYERLQKIHKRLTEAHSVLCHPRRRAIYNTCLRRSGTLRYVPDQIPERARRELALCQTPEGKDAIADCLEARSVGDWHRAAVAVRCAVEREPGNDELRALLAVISHIHTIAQDEDHTASSKEGR